jgi:predicted amidohydrolase YtcJ
LLTLPRNDMSKIDLLFKNANVITMDAARPHAETIAVSGGKIALEAVPDKKTRVLDCLGKTVVPGFIDAHLHFFSLVSKLLSIDLSPPGVRSIADIKETLRRKAASLPAGALVRGTDYNEFYLAEKYCPSRYDLDEAVPDRPVVIRHRSLHAYVLNSLALAMAGIDSETPEAPGSRIERDLETGEPNGILVDIPDSLRNKIWPPFSPTEFAEGVRLADDELISKGITSFTDASYTNNLERWNTVEHLQKEGKLRSRVTMMCGPATFCAFMERAMRTGAGDDWLKLGAVKFLLEIRPDQDELNQAALACHDAGFQVAFHAVEEKTVAAAVSAVEYVEERSPVTGRRHRLEHCGECPPYLLERLRKLGLIIVTQPSNLYYNGERYLATVAPAQLPWLYRVKAPLDAGVTVAGSSDAPVVPCNPLVGICSAVTRRAASGQTLLPAERVSPQQALALSTINAAYADFAEGTKGSLIPGKLADWVVLSGDPTRVPPDKIKDIHVEMTIIGGKIVYER